MKPIVIILLIITFQYTSHSQNVDCDSLAYEYYGDAGIIDELSFFCEGVEEAENTQYLAIRALGDPEHLSGCDLYSFEAYGVKLELTGDIVMYGQIEKNDGFNAVMIPRIKDALGAEYEKLGKFDSSWLAINDENMIRELISIFYHSPFETDSTYIVFIDSVALSNSVFQTFEGVQFETIYNDPITLSQFYSGAIISKYGRDRIYLKLDFSNYLNPNNICEASGGWIFPYPYPIYNASRKK